jgi:hypothetical protein
MSERLASTLVFDDTSGMQRIPDRDYNRRRSAHLCFTRAPGERGAPAYDVRAWGPAFPDNGAGGYRGWLTRADLIEEGIAVLRDTWREQVIEHKHENGGGLDGPATVFPFVDERPPGADDEVCKHLDEIGLRLARAGNDLFRLLFFRGGDPGMREIGEQLLRALGTCECIVTMESDELFVPWNLLYTPPEGEGDDGLEDSWSFDGFWGHRHLIEHSFSRVRSFDSRISMPGGGPVRVGLNVDERVDAQYPPTRFVAALPGIFDDRARATAVTTRRNKDELAHAFRTRSFDDHITCFGCHGEVTPADGRIAKPHLELGDGQKIYGSELASWLSVDEPMPMRPLVFVACQGAQLSSAFYPAAGQELLRNGARCLLGPQIDLPRAFAREYTTRLFTAFLDEGARLGDIVRSLARAFARETGNPLGLIFSLYRGVDVHLWPQDPAEEL